MSKRLVGIRNSLSEPVTVRVWDGSASSRDYACDTGQTPVDCNIPDNSDPKTYWTTQRIEVGSPNGEPINFWDDDYNSYKIAWSRGANPPAGNGSDVTGGLQGGDGTHVVIHVFQQHGSGDKQLASVALTYPDRAPELLDRFREFAYSARFTADAVPPADEVRKMYSTGQFQTTSRLVEACGYTSFGFVWGTGSDFGGVLTNLSGGITYTIQSSIMSLPVVGNAFPFIGLYCSTEQVHQNGGAVFFAETGMPSYIGPSPNAFTTASGLSGLLICDTGGLSLETYMMGESTTAFLA